MFQTRLKRKKFKQGKAADTNLDENTFDYVSDCSDLPEYMTDEVIEEKQRIK